MTTNTENTSANLRGIALSWKKRVMMAVSTTATINCLVNECMQATKFSAYSGSNLRLSPEKSYAFLLTG
jgi:hypothetical protein